MHKPGAAPSPPGHPPPRLPLCYLVGNRINNFVKGNKIGLGAVKRDWLQGPGGMSKGPSPQLSTTGGPGSWPVFTNEPRPTGERPAGL